MSKQDIVEALLADWLKAKTKVLLGNRGDRGSTVNAVGSHIHRGMKVALELGVRLNIDPDLIEALKIYMDDESFSHPHRAVAHAEHGGYTTSEVVNLITGDKLTYASNGFLHYQLREDKGTTPVGADPWYSWHQVELHPVVIPPLPQGDLFQ